MGEFFNRAGKSISIAKYRALHADDTYKRVAETMLPDGKWISTVWLGSNHAFGDNPPLIFETMVFAPGDSLDELAMRRYQTEEAALIGHELIVLRWSIKWALCSQQEAE